LRPIREAQEAGLPVYAETCPQYLNLTQDIIDQRGALATIGPPIRSAQDNEALWAALRDGTLSGRRVDPRPRPKT
jgi:dihydroorotase-like cyclic amidohydrolase